MPTAVEYDPAEGQQPGTQSEAKPGPIQVSAGEINPGPISDSGRPSGPIIKPGGLFLGGALVMIIAVLIIAVLLPGQTLLDFAGCPGGLNGGTRGGITDGTRNVVNGSGMPNNGSPDNGVPNNGAPNNALIGLIDVLRGDFGQPPIGPLMAECSQGNMSQPGSPKSVAPDDLSTYMPQPSATPTCMPYSVWHQAYPNVTPTNGQVCDPPPTSVFSGVVGPKVMPLSTATPTPQPPGGSSGKSRPKRASCPPGMVCP